MAKRRAQKQKVSAAERIRNYLVRHPNTDTEHLCNQLKVTKQQVYQTKCAMRKKSITKKPITKKSITKKPKGWMKPAKSIDTVKITIDLHGKVLTFDADTVVITNDSISAKFN